MLIFVKAESSLKNYAEQFVSNSIGTPFYNFIPGLNKTLVEMCLEYLNQPLAKKEEGLFRVSGDSSIIKSLHSAFMTPDMDEESLRLVK